jgi:hypothetical protein
MFISAPFNGIAEFVHTLTVCVAYVTGREITFDVAPKEFFTVT